MGGLAMRTRPPRPGTLVADVAAFLGRRGSRTVEQIHAAVNRVRQRRKLPPVSLDSVRGALNSNVVGKGHELFERERRGVYSLSKRAPRR